MNPLYFAMLSTFLFALSSIYFTLYAKKSSAEWMNFYKAFVAAIGFFMVCWAFDLFTPMSLNSFLFLIGSGLMGLMVGDVFLIKAFTSIGPSRTLMIFSFQPLLIGFSSFILFNQKIQGLALVALIFLILCILTFSFESYKREGHWELRGLSFALLGVALDAFGILMTRAAMDESAMSPYLANFLRAGAAVFGFFIYRLLKADFRLREPFKKLSPIDKWKVTLAGFGGTFLSLGFYLFAIQRGQLALVTAISGTGPLIATFFEILIGKKKLTPYLLVGLLFFIIGFSLISLSSLDTN